MQEKQAALYMSLPYTVSAAACPIFGYLVDKTGRAILWILLAMSMLCYIHYSFAWIPDFPPMWGVVGMGLAYSICAAALCASLPPLSLPLPHSLSLSHTHTLPHKLSPLLTPSFSAKSPAHVARAMLRCGVRG